MKEIVNKTDKFIVYKYGDVYRVHVYADKNTRTKIQDLKSFITKNIEKVKRFLLILKGMYL
ncbi:MAG: hypothetical protein ACRDBY_06340 [Cetobacterium sp.]